MKGRSPWRSRAPQAVAQPIGNIREYVPAVLFGPDENLIPLKTLDIEKRGVGNPKSGIDHQPNQILQILAGPHSGTCFILPLDLHNVAGLDDATEFGVRERPFIRGLARTDRSLNIRADRRFGDPFAVEQNRKNARRVVRRLPFARGPSFQLAQNRSISSGVNWSSMT